MSVAIETYEIIGKGREIADQFQADKAKARTAFWAFSQDVGGAGYRPSSWSGALRSVMFEGDLPIGWKRVGREGRFTEAMPRKSTRAGKALIERIAELPSIPQPDQLAAQLGYSPHHIPTGDGKIYFASELRVYFPEERHFIRLPISTDMDFEADSEQLRFMRESEFMRIVEEHNAEAKRQREAKQ